MSESNDLNPIKWAEKTHLILKTLMANDAIIDILIELGRVEPETAKGLIYPLAKLLNLTNKASLSKKRKHDGYEDYQVDKTIEDQNGKKKQKKKKEKKTPAQRILNYFIEEIIKFANETKINYPMEVNIKLEPLDYRKIEGQMKRICENLRRTHNCRIFLMAQLGQIIYSKKEFFKKLGFKNFAEKALEYSKTVDNNLSQRQFERAATFYNLIYVNNFVLYFVIARGIPLHTLTDNTTLFKKAITHLYEHNSGIMENLNAGDFKCELLLSNDELEEMINRDKSVTGGQTKTGDEDINNEQRGSLENGKSASNGLNQHGLQVNETANDEDNIDIAKDQEMSDTSSASDSQVDKRLTSTLATIMTISNK